MDHAQSLEKDKLRKAETLSEVLLDESSYDYKAFLKKSAELQSWTHEHTVFSYQEFERFYARYPKKDSKGYARIEWIKLDPDPELIAQLHGSLGSQKRWRKKAKEVGEFIPAWKKLEAWIVGECWINENPTSFQDLHQKKTATPDKQCECGQIATHQGHSCVWMCQTCWLNKHGDEWRIVELRNACRRLGLKRGDGREVCLPLIEKLMHEFLSRDSDNRLQTRKKKSESG